MHFFFEPFDDKYVKAHRQRLGDVQPLFFSELVDHRLDRPLFKKISAEELHDCLCFARYDILNGGYDGIKFMQHVIYYEHSGFSQSIFLINYFTKSNAKLFIINNHLAMEAENSLMRVKIIENRIIPILKERRDIKKEVLQTWVSIAAEQLIRYGKAVEANQLLDILES